MRWLLLSVALAGFVDWPSMLFLISVGKGALMAGCTRPPSG
jgi:hypothetical protein